MIHARDIRGIDGGKRHVDASDDVGVRAPRSTVRGVHRARAVDRDRGPGRPVIIIIIIVVVAVVVARDAARRREREERPRDHHRRERHPSKLSRAVSRSRRASRLARGHDATKRYFSLAIAPEVRAEERSREARVARRGMTIHAQPRGTFCARCAMRDARRWSFWNSVPRRRETRRCATKNQHRGARAGASATIVAGAGAGAGVAVEVLTPSRHVFS